MLSPTQQPQSFLLHATKESIAALPVRICMPRGEPTAAFFGRQIPFRVGGHLPVLVDDLQVLLAGFVEEVVTVGIVPPLAQSGGVREQGTHLGHAEDIVPQLGDLRDVI